MAKLSGRAAQAVEVLRAGGCFRYALERAWQGGEKFKMRLRAPGGAIVKGVGYAAKRELEEAGMLASRYCAPSSVWPQEWILRPEPAAEAA